MMFVCGGELKNLDDMDMWLMNRRGTTAEGKTTRQQALLLNADVASSRTHQWQMQELVAERRPEQWAVAHGHGMTGWYAARISSILELRQPDRPSNQIINQVICVMSPNSMIRVMSSQLSQRRSVQAAKAADKLGGATVVALSKEG